ncbi:putative 2-aminoethylphosphonate ABC transporter permease subunit [Denitrificimonas sp. JX-1]|uniref:2-aminoethylphosphonate ABC transporter permease subunit n=1 Tax=Denitrificimonas halotolerans TaxID=3098930 RepID=A0ABU5GPA0_9GAMM|nr:putative 2-aminoethylphosphonate ABC transporter permease subunit [Denitrificimonas sp. JX-1]MDY7218342.1 putative 2-aminoethylphosphonate ABC transporter permease subunit [Denitrificimonas sp. JX-1]
MNLPAPGARSMPLMVQLSQLRHRWGFALLLLMGCVTLTLLVFAPLYTLLSKSVENKAGEFVGLANFAQYLGSSAFESAFFNSLWVASLSTVLVVLLAFAAAWALTRTRLALTGLIRGILIVPILAPSLLSAISLVYLFGNQGLLKSWLFGADIYGPIGVVLGSVFWTFPHALMIILTSMENADGRHYEAAASLKASPLRIFWTVTVPGARYGLISAAFVVFTLVITDFGVPKVIGGQFNVLATDIYKQVVGQQQFEMGAVVSVLLLVPALLAFAADRYVQRKQIASFTAQSVPYRPQVNKLRDAVSVLLLLPTVLFILAILGTAVYASFVTFWPYNLDLSLKNYQFDLMDGGGWGAYFNSIQMALGVMALGTVLVFFNAWLMERTPQPSVVKGLFQLLAMLPLAVPGLVLGLSYIFFFNNPNNPLGVIYGSLFILILCTVAHFYAVSHLTAVTAIKQLDREFEAVGESLKASRWRVLFTVTVPLCLPAILDVALYLFVNAMTTVSAVVFLYGHESQLASVAVLNMDEAGDTAAAAAMAVLITATCAAAKLLQGVLRFCLDRKTKVWRQGRV